MQKNERRKIQKVNKISEGLKKIQEKIQVPLQV